MAVSRQERNHIVLHSHPNVGAKPVAISWGASSAAERGPVLGTLGQISRRNVIGTHSGSYAIYRALAVASGQLDPLHKPDLTHTAPTVSIGPVYPGPPAAT